VTTPGLQFGLHLDHGAQGGHDPLHEGADLSHGDCMADLNDAEEEAWCKSERDRVTAYQENEGLSHVGVGDWPAWHLSPYVAVWAIESVKNPGWVGWWAISGDLPTDYTTCGPERHPREGIRDIAARWKHAAECWAEKRVS
jgi:hypothetical protein